MLMKMLIQGTAAAVLIGSAAAVYAVAKDNGYLSPEATQNPAGTQTASDGDDGYIHPAAKTFATGERDHSRSRKRSWSHERYEHDRYEHDEDNEDDD